MSYSEKNRHPTLVHTDSVWKICLKYLNRLPKFRVKRFSNDGQKPSRIYVMVIKTSGMSPKVLSANNIILMSKSVFLSQIVVQT